MALNFGHIGTFMGHEVHVSNQIIDLLTREIISNNRLLQGNSFNSSPQAASRLRRHGAPLQPLRPEAGLVAAGDVGPVPGADKVLRASVHAGDLRRRHRRRQDDPLREHRGQRGSRGGLSGERGEVFDILRHHSSDSIIKS